MKIKPIQTKVAWFASLPGGQDILSALAQSQTPISGILEVLTDSSNQQDFLESAIQRTGKKKSEVVDWVQTLLTILGGEFSEETCRIQRLAVMAEVGLSIEAVTASLHRRIEELEAAPVVLPSPVPVETVPKLLERAANSLRQAYKTQRQAVVVEIQNLDQMVAEAIAVSERIETMMTGLHQIASALLAIAPAEFSSIEEIQQTERSIKSWIVD